MLLYTPVEMSKQETGRISEEFNHMANQAAGLIPVVERHLYCSVTALALAEEAPEKVIASRNVRTRDASKRKIEGLRTVLEFDAKQFENLHTTEVVARGLCDAQVIVYKHMYGFGEARNGMKIVDVRVGGLIHEGKEVYLHVGWNLKSPEPLSAMYVYGGTKNGVLEDAKAQEIWATYGPILKKGLQNVFLGVKPRHE